jgi:hypothetical protein
MRRTSLRFFALLFVFACSPRAADHAVAPAPSAGPVVISLATKPGGTFKFTVVPQSIEISITNQSQIEWIVSNNTDWPLTNVQVTNFQSPSGKTDPFGNGGTFSFPSVNAANSVSKPSGAAKSGSQETYTYIVTGTITVNGNPVPVSLDPRVIISQ